MSHLVLDTEDRARHRVNDSMQRSLEARKRALKEELDSNSITVAPDDGVNVANLLAQMGNPLASEEVQRRLKKCNSALHFIRSPQFPELTGVYLILDEWEHDGSSGFRKKLRHLFGMESGIMPEFTVRHVTKKKVPNPELLGQGGHFERGGKFVTTDTPKREVDWVEVETYAGETRGWRTVLVRLLHMGLIGRADVEQYFGWTPSRPSAYWHNATEKWNLSL
jgi:hypothetical protein